MISKNIESGTFFDSISNIMSLNCTSEQFEEAIRHFNTTGETLPVLRDYLHEHAHHIQFSTTTVGYYLTLLQDYQFERLHACCQCVLDNKESVYPLMRNIMNIQTGLIINKKAAHHYYYWALGEIIRLYMWGDNYQISQYTKHMMQGIDLFDYYLEQDLELKKTYHISQKWNGKMASESEEILDMVISSGFLEATSGINLASILESEALLAEYWFDEVADQRLLGLLEKTSMTIEQSYYLWPLMLFKRNYDLDLKNRADFLSFKLGYHAICQIVLNSPLLPYQTKENLLPEIDVIKKFGMLILYSKIPLPKSEGDYERYINDILQKFQIKSLDESYKELKQNEHLLMSGLLFPGTFKEEIYISAQNMYHKKLLNYYLFLNGTKSTRDMFFIKFLDSDLEYPSDKIMYLLNYMTRLYYKELLYGYTVKNSKKEIEVHTPVKLSVNTMKELEFFERLTNKFLYVKYPGMPRLKMNNGS